MDGWHRLGWMGGTVWAPFGQECVFGATHVGRVVRWVAPFFARWVGGTVWDLEMSGWHRLSETVRWVGGTFHSYVQKMEGDRWTVPPNQIAVPKVGATYPILLVRWWHLVCCMGGTYCGWHRLYLMGGTFCVLFGDWS